MPTWSVKAGHAGRSSYTHAVSSSKELMRLSAMVKKSFMYALDWFNTYTIIRVTSPPPSTTLKKGTMGAELKTHASNSYNASKLV